MFTRSTWYKNIFVETLSLFLTVLSAGAGEKKIAFVDISRHRIRGGVPHRTTVQVVTLVKSL
jgi:hypothetical protein